MLVCAMRCLSSAGSSLEQSLLEKIGFIHVLDRSCILTESRRDRLDSNGPTTELLDDRTQNRTVHSIEAEVVDLEAIQRMVGDGPSDNL